VVNNLLSPFEAGITYHPILDSLLLSVDFPSGQPNNFVIIGTNSFGVLTMTNWSSVAGVPNEVEMVTAQATTNGFIQGETYFGDGSVIDKLSPDGSQWTTDWCSLTNETVTDDTGLTGICFDNSGLYSGNLVATTAGGNIWLIQSDANGNANPVFLTNILGSQALGGVITLTNDVAKWGPWAGKILTGDIYNLYAIDTNGIVTPYYTVINYEFGDGVFPESLCLIPANEDLYFIDASNNKLVKISRAALAPYVGDLAIVSTTFGADSIYARVIIYAWDPVNSVFETKVIQPKYGNNYYFGVLEDATFAPINLPSQ
jgi:hypothetical protein